MVSILARNGDGSTEPALLNTVAAVLQADDVRPMTDRVRLNKPMVITSGYRCQDHCARIGSTMTHTTGQAVDVSVSGGHAYELLGIALEEGFTGIGVKQKGTHKGRFLHLDDLKLVPGERTRPTFWSYWSYNQIWCLRV
ncbi:D-Ala-D-Ala carboxypeptidase family metallohydrolase [uncultured Microbulbifer sp.]|uniref:D-Ala-D-Ala carboxypeptidase family metallohydrolase n=1 Tax=uncultured Microbulbifer sp. TaxID=348147 RepID=UPI002622D7BC|nr:D-Ala-D-Ala carboxypeptidase family metallohydrolase [uncultured Microbulbifer sp.]